jgi:hypothetical protein
MRRFLEPFRRAWEWSKTPEAVTAFGIVLAVQGLRIALEGIEGRVKALESRGWAPLDDVATVGDLVRLEEKLDGEPLPPEEERLEAEAEEAAAARDPDELLRDIEEGHP